MISNPLQEAVTQQLIALDLAQQITGVRPVGGGSINRAYRLQTDGDVFFLKVNSASAYPGMFEAEQLGLQLLKAHFPSGVPLPLAVDQTGDETWLLMNWVESGGPRDEFWTEFGASLAAMHQHTQSQFGLDHNNYIGSLPQSNSNHATWSEFFVTERLEPLVRDARDGGAISRELSDGFGRFYARLDGLFPEEPPALLHGDLWSGNYMTAADGRPCIIDPAVYFGHREMDLGMSRLFGGFAPEFYRAYHEHYPLESGWEGRLDIANLYPLMVHVILFGGGYVHQVQSILRPFI